ncbi:hypothetical protein ACHAW5_001698 [Stephanodiscus triporus]|uniref:Uncharacterized protein n=1 Tax=Stephanodiscus triporus TaxID=2934178 RepID=A0ABD3Q8H9_9STRA
MTFFETVHVCLSPADASKLSGRYETAVDVNGKSVPVLRSIRHAPKELVLQGSMTPSKAKPSASDIDDLCDKFAKKMNVTPNKKKPSGSKVKSTEGEKATNEVSDKPLKVVDGGLFGGFVIVPKTGGCIDSTKKSKKEMKALALSKAKAWSESRVSAKTAKSTRDQSIAVAAQENSGAKSNVRSTRSTMK